MKLQILLIFTLVIIGAIAQRNERRWRRRPIEEEEVNDNQLDVEEKEVSSSSSEVDATPEDTPTVQKRRRCKHKHRGGRIIPGDNTLVDGEQNQPEGNDAANENDGQEKCKRHRHRHRHHGRHGVAEGHKGNRTHNPEWHQKHNISMPDGNSTRRHHHEHTEEWHKAHPNIPMPDSNGHHHEHTEEWHKAHNISMPDANRHHHRPHHHHRHHHHHHNRTTTTSTTTPSPAVERSTWNVNEE